MSDEPKYDFDKTNFSVVEISGKSFYFDRASNFKEVIIHKKKSKYFKYHKNLSEFLESNSLVSIFFTLNPLVKNFEKHENDLVVNYTVYRDFCRDIEARTSGRAHAFFGKHINLDQLLLDADKAAFVRENLDESQLIDAINMYPEDSKKKFADALRPSGVTTSMEIGTVSKEDLITSLARFLSDKDVQDAFFKNMPRIQIETLKNHVEFLESNLDKNEAFVQEWIDEDNGRFRKKRCLIFGIEYVDPKREGFLEKKKFDILAEQNRNSHVIIELKSPNSEVFKVDITENGNDGQQTTYNLSSDLSRAIPQILGYKHLYEKASPEELEALGIADRKPVSKCIIVIGKSEENEVWKGNISRLRSSLSGIEIYTYTDLIDKLKNTIKNLEESL